MQQTAEKAALRTEAGVQGLLRAGEQSAPVSPAQPARACSVQAPEQTCVHMLLNLGISLNLFELELFPVGHCGF